jgi:hypothetical protein
LITPEGTGGELASWCTRTLATRGATVVTIPVPAHGQDRFALAEQITRVLADGENAADGRPMAGVVSLLGAAEEPMTGGSASAGLAGTLALVQALGDARVDAPLWVLTRGAVAAVAGEAPSPVQAQIWGLGRVAALEYPERWGGLIDLPPGLGGEGSPRTGTVLDERVSGWICAVLSGRGEDQVAVRGTGIRGRRLTRVPRPLPVKPRVPRGSVLVTGGTGTIGAHTARWLADRGTPALVLASRSGPAAMGVPALVAALAATGTSVTVAACDAGSRTQLGGLIGQITVSGT